MPSEPSVSAAHAAGSAGAGSLLAERATLWGDLFVAANLAFLSLDVFLAHEANAFRRPAEHIPVAFGALGAVLLAVPCARRKLRDPLGLTLGWLVASLSILIGVAGMVLHLRDTFFVQQSLRNLVYTAPFAAPLSYVGLGLLVLLDRLERGRAWAQWVLLLALGGFIGTFALALADHAQNGFFRVTEWIPVVTSAFAIGFVSMTAWRPTQKLVKACAAVMLLSAFVGGLGCVLHVLSNTERPGASLWEEFLYGAPLFAPLLMCDLAVLAGLGLCTLWREDAAA